MDVCQEGCVVGALPHVYIFCSQLYGCIIKLRHPPVSTHYRFVINETLSYPAVTICRNPSYKTNVLQVRMLFPYNTIFQPGSLGFRSLALSIFGPCIFGIWYRLKLDRTTEYNYLSYSFSILKYNCVVVNNPICVPDSHI